MIKTLFTIGYSGLQLDEFVEQLQLARVQMILDVREIPLSRKKGFSKNALAGNLEKASIQYRHFKWLGSPKDLRHEVRETRDYNRFFKGVTSHLCQPQPTTQLEDALHLARQFRSCLLCCCENWQFCHRRCVVDAMLKRNKFLVEHLLDPSCGMTNSKAA